MRNVGLRTRKETNSIFIDHTNTPSNLDITKHQVEMQHRKEGVLGYKYHYFITLDGKVEKGRADDAIGFGLGLHNDEAIGIQLAGSTNFTYHQVSSLKNLIKTLQQKYGKLIIETSSKDIEQELK
jgi:N-acetyl-anhydromuramyl-L-alanine amidase AmpD|tara:strand:- start:564 stop:938 length:375 start_codon:yes stop_codon:yes gene_type:complete